MKIFHLLAGVAFLACSAAHAGPVETTACEAIGRLTPAELQQIQTSIATSAGRAPAIIEAAKARFFACITTAIAADAAKSAATAAVVAASMAVEK